MEPTESSSSPFMGLQDAEKMPIHVDNLAHMYTTDIGNNDSKYTKIIKEYNNAFVARWKIDMLIPKSVNNSVIVHFGTDLWEIWNQAHEIRGLMSIHDKLTFPSDEMVEHWLKYYRRPIKEIARDGKSAATIGFHVLKTAYSAWYVEKKYNDVFKSEDYDEWVYGYRKHNMLFMRKIERFDLKDVIEKFKIIHLNTYDTNIGKNEQALVEKVKEYNIEIVKEFEEVLKASGLQDAEGEKRRKLWSLWLMYYDLKTLAKHLEYTNHPSEELRNWWLDFFQKDLEVLLDYGRPCLSMGMDILQGSLASWYIQQKIEKVFKIDEPLDLAKLYDRYTEHIGLFTRSITPFNIDEAKDKVAHILAHNIEVRH